MPDTTTTNAKPSRKTYTQTETGQRLTWLQEQFCRAYVKDPTNLALAARRAGYQGRDSTIRQVGAAMIRKPYILARIEELRGEIGGKELIDVGWCLEQAKAGMERCMERDETNAKGYLDQINRMLGAYEADNRQRQTQVGMVIM